MTVKINIGPGATGKWVALEKWDLPKVWRLAVCIHDSIEQGIGDTYILAIGCWTGEVSLDGIKQTEVIGDEYGTMDVLCFWSGNTLPNLPATKMVFDKFEEPEQAWTFDLFAELYTGLCTAAQQIMFKFEAGAVDKVKALLMAKHQLLEDGNAGAVYALGEPVQSKCFVSPQKGIVHDGVLYQDGDEVPASVDPDLLAHWIHDGTVTAQIYASAPTPAPLMVDPDAPAYLALDAMKQFPEDVSVVIGSNELVKPKISKKVFPGYLNSVDLMPPLNVVLWDPETLEGDKALFNWEARDKARLCAGLHYGAGVYMVRVWGTPGGNRVRFMWESGQGMPAAYEGEL